MSTFCSRCGTDWSKSGEAMSAEKESHAKTKAELAKVSKELLNQNATLKTTNETLNETVAMLREAGKPFVSSTGGVATDEDTYNEDCRRLRNAILSTDSTVKEWMAKRDVEKELEFRNRLSILALVTEHGASGLCIVHGNFAMGWSGKKSPITHCGLCLRYRTEKLEATLAEKEMEMKSAIDHRDKWLEDLRLRCSAVHEGKNKAEEALAKRDKEAIRFRNLVDKIQLTAFGEDGSGNGTVGSLEDEIHKALSSTANLGARYKAELLRAEAKGWAKVSNMYSIIMSTRLYCKDKATALTKKADELESKEKTK